MRHTPLLFTLLFLVGLLHGAPRLGEHPPVLVVLNPRHFPEPARAVALDAETMQLQDLPIPITPYPAIWALPGSRVAFANGVPHRFSVRVLEDLLPGGGGSGGDPILEVEAPDSGLGFLPVADGCGWLDGIGLVLTTAFQDQAGKHGRVTVWDGQSPTAPVHLLEGILPGAVARAGHLIAFLDLELEPVGGVLALLDPATGAWWRSDGDGAALGWGRCLASVQTPQGPEVWIGAGKVGPRYGPPAQRYRVIPGGLEYAGQVADEVCPPEPQAIRRREGHFPVYVRALNELVAYSPIDGVALGRIGLGLPCNEWYWGPFDLAWDPRSWTWLAPAARATEAGPWYLARVNEDLSAVTLATVPWRMGLLTLVGP
jgi:hypothetical protein